MNVPNNFKYDFYSIKSIIVCPYLRIRGTISGHNDTLTIGGHDDTLVNEDKHGVQHVSISIGISPGNSINTV